MNNVYSFIKNIIEIAVGLFGLAVVSSVLFGYDVITATLEILSEPYNLVVAVAIFFLWAIAKEGINE